MKFHILILTIFLLTSCSSQPANNQADENRTARNREISVKNEVNQLTRLAQKLEQQGRALELLRKVQNPQSQNECAAQQTDAQNQIKEFETRVRKLPENYQKLLLPMIGDLNECAGCQKTTIESCVKARASINDAIKELYP